MGRIKNTIELAKVSWRVLRHDRELLFIPILSFLSAIGVIVILAIPTIALLDTSSSSTAGEESTASPALILVGIVGALSLSLVSVFFNGALIAGAHERLTGGDPTVRSALSRAVHRLPGLVPWALLTATVGLILQALREKAGFLARFVLGFVGAAWEIATFLVVPAIIIDDKGAIDGLKESAGLLKKTWGENLAARVGFGILGIVAMIPAIIVIVIAGSLGGPILVLGVIVAIGWVATVIVVLTALNAIFQTALYLYATTGVSPAGFEQSSLGDSFGRR